MNTSDSMNSVISEISNKVIHPSLGLTEDDYPSAINGPVNYVE